MAEDVGSLKVKLGVDTAEFNEGMGKLATRMKILGEDFKNASGGLDQVGDASQIAALKAKSLTDKIEIQQKIVDKLRLAHSKSADATGESSKKTLDYELKLKRAEGALQSMEQDLSKTTKQIDEFGKESDQSGDQIKVAGKKAEQSGDDAKKGESGWSKLGNGIKSAGALAGKAVAAMGTAALAAGSALVAASVSGASYADDVLTVSAQTGIATDELQKYKYAAELVDVPVETLTKSMAKQIKSMAAVQDGSKGSVAAYKQLGVTVLNADGSLRDGQTVYWETIDALGKMTNETERDALGMELLGKSAQELNPLIEVGSARMKELGAQAEKAGYIMSGETLNSFGALDDQLQYLKVGAGAAKNALGSVLLPMLTTLSTDGVSMLGTFTNGINNANGDIGKMMDVVASMLNGIVNKIIEYLPQIIDAGMKILGAIGKGILDNLPIIITAAVTILTSLVQGLIQAMPQIIDGALLLITSLTTALIENLPMILDAAIKIVIQLAQGLAQALPELIPQIVAMIILMQDTLIDNLPLIIEASIQIIVAVIAGLIQAIPMLIGRLPEIIFAVIDAFAKTDWGAIGKNIIDGIGDGLTKFASGLADKAKEALGGVIDGIKNFLGIASPSKLFRDQIGLNMGLGIASGLDKSGAAIDKAMAGIIPSDIESNINVSARGVSGSSGGTMRHEHTGTIRIEGVNDKGQLTGVVDMVMNQLRMDLMMSGA